VDDVTRETLALVVDTSIGGARVARVLDELALLDGCADGANPGPGGVIVR